MIKLPIWLGIVALGLLLTFSSGVFWTANLGGELYGWRWIGFPRAYALEWQNMHGWSLAQMREWMNDITDDWNTANWELRLPGLSADWLFWSALTLGGCFAVALSRRVFR